MQHVVEDFAGGFQAVIASSEQRAHVWVEQRVARR